MVSPEPSSVLCLQPSSSILPLTCFLEPHPRQPGGGPALPCYLPQGLQRWPAVWHSQPPSALLPKSLFQQASLLVTAPFWNLPWRPTDYKMQILLSTGCGFKIGTQKGGVLLLPYDRTLYEHPSPSPPTPRSTGQIEKGALSPKGKSRIWGLVQASKFS